MSADSGGQHDTAVSLGAGGGEERERLLCQVPGCAKELAGLKDYHQRYRICDVHIKLPQVRCGLGLVAAVALVGLVAVAAASLLRSLPVPPLPFPLAP